MPEGAGATEDDRTVQNGGRSVTQEEQEKAAEEDPTHLLIKKWGEEGVLSIVPIDTDMGSLPDWELVDKEPKGTEDRCRSRILKVLEEQSWRRRGGTSEEVDGG